MGTICSPAQSAPDSTTKDDILSHNRSEGKQNESDKEIIILSSRESLGDCKNIETMDYCKKVLLPWVSLIVPKLINHGFKIRYLNWLDYDNKEMINWGKDGKNFVLITSIWDYADYSDKFVQFLSFMKNLVDEDIISIENNIDFIFWNYSKVYLSKFDQANQMSAVFMPKSRFDEKYENQNYNECFDASLSELNLLNDDNISLVIKGVIDQSTNGLKYFRNINEKNKNSIINNEIIPHLNELILNRNGFIIQPFYNEISTFGEFSFVFFENEMCAAFIKVAGNKDNNPIGINAETGGKWFFIDFNNQTQIQSVLNNIKLTYRNDFDSINGLKYCQLAHKQCVHLFENDLKNIFKKENLKYPLLYLRIDGFVQFKTNTFKIMEIEGIEPYMGFNIIDDKQIQDNVITKYVNGIVKRYDEM